MLRWYELQSIGLRHLTYKVLATSFYIVPSTIVRVLVEQERHAVCELPADEVGNTPKDDSEVLVSSKGSHFFHDGEEDLGFILFS